MVMVINGNHLSLSISIYLYPFHIFIVTLLLTVYSDIIWTVTLTIVDFACILTCGQIHCGEPPVVCCCWYRHSSYMVVVSLDIVFAHILSFFSSGVGTFATVVPHLQHSVILMYSLECGVCVCWYCGTDGWCVGVCPHPSDLPPDIPFSSLLSPLSPPPPPPPSPPSPTLLFSPYPFFYHPSPTYHHYPFFHHFLDSLGWYCSCHMHGVGTGDREQTPSSFSPSPPFALPSLLEWEGRNMPPP